MDPSTHIFLRLFLAIFGRNNRIVTPSLLPKLAFSRTVDKTLRSHDMKFKSVIKQAILHVVLFAEQNAVNGMLLIRKCDIIKGDLWPNCEIQRSIKQDLRSWLCSLVHSSFFYLELSTF